MTPQYIFHEMTMDEVQESISHVMRWELHPQNKKHYDALIKGMEEWLCPRDFSKQDLSWIKPPIGRVIKRHG